MKVYYSFPVSDEELVEFLKECGIELTDVDIRDDKYVFCVETAWEDAMSELTRALASGNQPITDPEILKKDTELIRDVRTWGYA